MSGLDAVVGFPRAADRRRYLHRSGGSTLSRRVFDLAVACLGLLLTVPLFLLVGVMIKLDSPGPIFFRQRRVGRHRRPFRMWKFRKMYEDLRAQGPMLTARYDPRLTPVGRFLERTKLDELPQLLNVLRGEMSIVGPRPEVPTFVDRFAPELWDQVLSVKPGVFGANQLRHRNESELYPPGCEDREAFYLSHILPDKLEVDARYAREASLSTDLWLLLRGMFAATFGAVTRRTLATRRLQLVNLLNLSILGVAGTIGAHLAAGRDPASRVALEVILLAALFKPACLVAFQVPKALPSSMTPDDFVRSFWCALCSAALMVFATFWLEGPDAGRLVVTLDTAFFVATLFLYKLLLYRVYVTFRVQRSRLLARRLILASLWVAPLSALVATLLGGASEVAGIRGGTLPIVLLALGARPATLLLLRPPASRSTIGKWLTAEWPRLATATVAGSGLVVLGSLLLSERVPDRGEVVLDAVLFLLAMTGLALWQNRRLASDPSLPGSPIARRRLLVVGSGIELSACVGAFASLPERDFELAGIVTPYGAQRTSTVGGHLVLGEVADLPELLAALAIDSVVVLPHQMPAGCAEFIERCCREAGVRGVSVSLLAGILSAGASSPRPEGDEFAARAARRRGPLLHKATPSSSRGGA